MYNILLSKKVTKTIVYHPFKSHIQNEYKQMCQEATQFRIMIIINKKRIKTICKAAQTYS